MYILTTNYSHLFAGSLVTRLMFVLLFQNNKTNMGRVTRLFLQAWRCRHINIQHIQLGHMNVSVYFGIIDNVF